MAALISIVTIVRNGESVIEKTIASVLSQKNSLVEYVVVDGASTDGTLGKIKKYHGQIDKYISEPDAGISDAFNKGIKLSTGKYIWLLNAGDILLNNSLAIVLKNAEASGADILYGHMKVQKRNGKERVFHSDHTQLKKFMSMSHPATIVKREVYEQIEAFKNQYKIAMDYDFLLRAVKAKKSFYKLDHELVLMESGGVSDQKWIESLYESHLVRIRAGNNIMSSLVRFGWTLLLSIVLRSKGILSRAVQ